MLPSATSPSWSPASRSSSTAAFRYVTLMEPGQQKQLYLIDKTDGTIYRSALTFPGSEEAFYPKWQYGDQLIDYCLTDDEEPCLTILRHRN